VRYLSKNSTHFKCIIISNYNANIMVRLQNTHKVKLSSSNNLNATGIPADMKIKYIL